MFQVIDSTSPNERKGFVIFISPKIYNKIAEEIIYLNSPAIKPIKIYLTPNGVIIEKIVNVFGKKYKSITKIQDFKVEGDFAESVSKYMEELKTYIFSDNYVNAKAQNLKETEFSK